MKLLYKIASFLIALCAKQTVGARALVIKDSQILLVEHTYTPDWYTIGGAVDPKESGLEALKRELYEEVGIKVKGTPELLGVYHNTRQGKDNHVILYLCQNFSQVPMKSDEILRAKWFPLKALPKNTTPATKCRVEEYLGIREKSDKW